jgi:hypothetical protein
MTQVTAHNRRTSSAIRKLVRKHYFQIGAERQPVELTDVFAITFRPNAQTGSFAGSLLRRIGTTAMIVLSYEPHPSKPDRLVMPIRGFRAQACSDGSVRYGGDAGCLFLYDGALIGRARAGGRAISAARNPTLVETVLRLDRACKRHVDRRGVLPRVPRLPRILLGFAPSEPPQIEDSPALRQLAARELRIPVGRLGANGSVLLDRLLRDIWERHLISPSAPSNPTGKWLVDAELYTHARQALEIFEDFTDLVGVRTWNPAHGVKLPQVDNPAEEVLRRLEVDTRQNFDQYLSDELIEKLELAMRQAVGVSEGYFTREEIYDGLTNPGRPLVGYSASLAHLRSKLGVTLSECCTDDDLLQAARDRDQPLLASGACKMQVVAKRDVARPAALRFMSDVLHRRIEADLSGDAWKARSKGSSRLYSEAG